MSAPGATPVTSDGTLDECVLARYLQADVAGDWRDLHVRQFLGGQSNPTYLLSTAARSVVLRKQPGGRLLPSAHAIDREFRVMQALAGTGVPVPAMIHFCSDAAVIGTPFYLMDHVVGRVFKDPLLATLPHRERASIHDAMNATLAKLHGVDYAKCGLSDYGRPGNYFARQIDRWSRQFRASETGTLTAMDELMRRLPTLVPADDRSGIVHGDFRIENLVYHESEPRVLAVLDWELSTLGHPLADLAYNCFPYHLPRKAFWGFSDVSLDGTGVPSEHEYIDRYFLRTGIRPVAPWGFYIAFSLFRLAAILQGVLRRALDGHASSPDSLERGQLAGLCANAGLAALERDSAPFR